MNPVDVTGTGTPAGMQDFYVGGMITVRIPRRWPAEKRTRLLARYTVEARLAGKSREAS